MGTSLLRDWSEPQLRYRKRRAGQDGGSARDLFEAPCPVIGTGAGEAERLGLAGARRPLPYGRDSGPEEGSWSAGDPEGPAPHDGFQSSTGHPAERMPRDPRHQAVDLHPRIGRTRAGTRPE